MTLIIYLALCILQEHPQEMLCVMHWLLQVKQPPVKKIYTSLIRELDLFKLLSKMHLSPTSILSTNTDNTVSTCMVDSMSVTATTASSTVTSSRNMSRAWAVWESTLFQLHVLEYCIIKKIDWYQEVALFLVMYLVRGESCSEVDASWFWQHYDHLPTSGLYNTVLVLCNLKCIK